MGVVFDDGYRTVGGTVSISGPVTVNEPIAVKGSLPDIPKIGVGNPLFQQFNIALNESHLKPFVLRRGTIINVHWKPISEAAEYIVTLYKSLFGASALYFMTEYRVERNRCFLAIPDLIDNGFIIQVAAENREGKVITKSRGILDQGDPRDW